MVPYARFAFGANLAVAGSFVAFAGAAAADPALFARWAAKDHGGHWPLFETLTPLVLIPGILAGGHALLRLRGALPSRWLAGWLLAWVLACVYFAGEELSWGQWYVGWETPEALRAVNKQGETNLHNISPWLDKKPRSLVELFILAAGLVAPLWLRARGALPAARHWLHWILGPSAGLAAAGVFAVSRLCKWFEVPPPLALLGDSEFRELWIAVFLSIYLASFALRLAQLPAGAARSA